ncbi:MAG: helix-turn-helix domain-containing protein [Bacteroidota bacterium]
MTNYHLLHEFVLVCGIVINVIILVLLGKKQGTFLHQELLRLFFLSVLMLFLFHYAGHHKIGWLYFITNVLTNGISFLIGPIIYYYIQSLFTEIDTTRPRFWLPFLPYLFYTLIVSVPFAFSNPTDGLFFQYIGFYLDNVTIFVLVETFFLLGCTLLAFRTLVTNEGAIKDFFSNVSTVNIQWSKRLLLCLILYLIIDLCFTVAEFFHDGLYVFDIYSNVLLMLLITLYLGHYGFFQSPILIPSFLLHPSEAFLAPSISDKSHLERVSIFSREEIVLIKKSLDNTLMGQQLYLNPTLNLTDLAKSTGLTDKKLSTFINQELATNFYELVNTHRINAFKKEVRLEQNQHLTIWAIANQCGFNSKTSFNRIFKKQMGCTPSQYQKSVD